MTANTPSKIYECVVLIRTLFEDDSFELAVVDAEAHAQDSLHHSALYVRQYRGSSPLQENDELARAFERYTNESGFAAAVFTQHGPKDIYESELAAESTTELPEPASPELWQWPQTRHV